MSELGPGPTSHTYYSQRLRLHYVDWGNNDAPPLLLLHGGRDHCRNWDWVANALRDKYHIIAPDLRGHGDSGWITSGSYIHMDFIYDIAQLIHQQGMAPLRIIGHSFGGSLALRYTSLYPDNVVKLVAIEGLGPSPDVIEKMVATPYDDRMRKWIDDLRQASGRTPRRYKTMEDAIARMQEENPHLREDQARHLTIHGISQNEDGTYTWKFDNYFRIFTPLPMQFDSVTEGWNNITCPTLLMRGEESWASDPVKDGRIKYFKKAELANFAEAGHWVHHDQLDKFLDRVTDFLG